MEKYFGVCYYPELYPKEKQEAFIREDIENMRRARFNVVRMAEFCWCLMEPREGVYDFDWLEEIVQQFPAPFFAALDGGVQLEEQALPDPDFPHGQMYILGEYCHGLLGRYIVRYYGSFAALAEQEDWTEEDWEDELYTTLAHEFTHHIEGRAGERGLERKDEQFIEEFRAGRGE